MNERDIFLAALELPDARARAEYLEKACGDNDILRAGVAELLAAHEKSGRFLHVPGDADRTVESCAESDLGFLEPPSKPGSLGRLGHYEISNVLGRGGFGIVFKAFDETLHRVVAIKTMAPHLAATSPPRKRFLREARAVAAIKHENVVAVFAVEEKPIPYLVMEFIAGESLQDYIDRTGPLEPAEVVSISRQIALGLYAAHSTGLIHRDIKPGNILLESGPERKVKITDFGLARAADDARLTQSGSICGTPMYMSPEQALGKPLDVRSDLFSLGSVMYVMACGRPPFRAESMLAVMKRVVEETPRPIREIVAEVPEWICRISGKLQAKDPADRYPSAKDAVEALNRGDAVEAKSTRRSWRSAAAIAATVGLLIAVAAFATFFRSNPTSPTPTQVERRDRPVANAQPDADRQAAEWVLSIGGTVRVNGEEKDIKAVDALPKEPFPLTMIALNPQKPEQLTADGLARFKNCQNLKALHLNGPSVIDSHLAHFQHCHHLTDLRVTFSSATDMGLANFKDCKRLASLDLSGTRVTDFGLEHFTGCKNLVDIRLYGTLVSDAGMVHFKDCRILESLILSGTQLSDLGLVHFKDCRLLYKLELNGTSVTDAALANFKNCPLLKFIGLAETKVSGSGLAHFKDCKFLHIIELTATPINDDGLKELAKVTKLVSVNLKKTKVTVAGIDALRKALPLLIIDWDGGLIDPKAKVDADRRASEFILNFQRDHGIQVQLDDVDLWYGKAEQLPNRPFRLTGVHVEWAKTLDDAALANFAGCNHLKTLKIWGSPVTEKEFAHFQNTTTNEEHEKHDPATWDDTGFVPGRK